jgi:hypothetical protein
MYDTDMGLGLSELPNTSVDESVGESVTGSSTSIDPLTQIEIEIERIIGQMNLLHAELVDHVRTVTSDGLTVGLGYSSPAHWLAIQSGLAPERCRELAMVATRAADFPHTLGILASGVISFDQALAVIKRAPAWADQQAGTMAQYATVSQMRRILGRYPFESEQPQSEDDRSLQESQPDTGVDDTGVNDTGVDEAVPAIESEPDTTEFFSLMHREDGSWELSGRLGPEHGLILDTALAEARDALFQRVGAGGSGNATRLPSLVDALREIADRSLDSISDPSRRDRFRIYLHLDAQSSTCTDAHGIRLPDALSGLARCEADLRLVLERDGIPVSVGRSSRVIPPHTRRMVVHRDHGCRVPGCLSQQHLHVHHIVEWSRGGPTDTHNLVALCPQHHRRIHDGHLTIEAPPGAQGPINAESPHGLRFRDSRGKVIGYRPLAPPTPCGTYPPQPFVHPSGEQYDAWSVSFSPPQAHRELRAVVGCTESEQSSFPQN